MDDDLENEHLDLRDYQSTTSNKSKNESEWIHGEWVHASGDSLRINEDVHVKFRLNPEKALGVLQELKAILGVSESTVSVSFVSDASIAQLNDKFRGKNAATDVLSFPQINKFNEEKFTDIKEFSLGQSLSQCLGDLVISLESAQRNAQSIGQPLDVEICFLMVHGCLHLMGFDHIEKNDEIEMLAKQREVMKNLEKHCENIVSILDEEQKS